MNSNRRADLQRKLTLSSVPRPPAGLVDRIKADIPQYLEKEPPRRKAYGAFAMRIAASVLVAVTSVVTVLYVVNSPRQEKQASVAPGPFAPAHRGIQTDTVAVAPTETVRLDIAEEAPVEIPTQIALNAPPPPPAGAATSAAAPQLARNEAVRTQNDEEIAVESGVEGSVQGGVAYGAIGGTPARLEESAPQERDAQPQSVAPRVAAPAPAAAPEPQFAPPPVMAAADAAASRSAPGIERRARKTTAASESRELFGISVDEQNFQRIRETLEAGSRPAPAAVDVEALVNYFAGPPERRPRRGVSLDVEASPAAIEAEGDHAILRFSIDTAEGRGLTPVASNVRVEIVFNKSVIAKQKRVGGDHPLTTESALRNGMSVTGLYALELHPGVTSTQHVATVRLRYQTVPGGETETVTRQIFGRDLARGWARATRRHRLASLGAVWGETLKGRSAGFDVARRAEELATQDPKDTRARELAAAAKSSDDGSP
jgi:hypothetical protein